MFELVTSYCKSNYRRIGSGEDPDREAEPVKELLRIKPIHIARWLKKIAYGTEEPGPGQRPLYARANTLYAHKRSLSYFMPRNLAPWDFNGDDGVGGKGVGNPAKGRILQKLIKDVEVFEMKGHGAKAKDARALTWQEWLDTLELAQRKVMPREKEIVKFLHPALLLTQFHLDGRLDDMVLLDIDEFRPYQKQSKSILACSIKASKNIHEKSDWHWQVLIGCGESKNCPIIAVAAYVGFFNDENALMIHPDRITERTGTGERKKEPTLPGFFRLSKDQRWGKSSISIRLNEILQVKLALSGNVSTHSVRKTSTETMQRAKVRRECSDQRGRWKTRHTDKKASASNIYHMSFQRWLDLNGAVALVKGRPVRYEVENLTDEIVRQVLPASRRLINGVGFLLCSAALWAYHNSRTLLPDSLITRIEKFGADRLESKRVVVKADDDNFISRRYGYRRGRCQNAR